MGLGGMMLARRMMRGRGKRKGKEPAKEEVQQAPPQPLPKPSMGSYFLALVFAVAIYLVTKNILLAVAIAGIMWYLSHHHM